jgi:hypothetical protein
VQSLLAAAFVLVSTGWARTAPAAVIPSSREVVVNTVTTGAQVNPAVAVGLDEGVLVVWEDNRFDNGGVHIRARKLGADLEPVANDFQVDAESGLWNRTPDAAALRDGSFVVVWHQGVEGGAILARKIASDGSLVSSRLAISSAATLPRTVC